MMTDSKVYHEFDTVNRDVIELFDEIISRKPFDKGEMKIELKSTPVDGKPLVPCEDE